MAFNSHEIENLLAKTGRRCCLCKMLHSVQVHHIIPQEEGGTDKIDNAIPLCPNCHNEVHSSHVSGRITRKYTVGELKQHRQRTIDQVQKATQWGPGSSAREEDEALILFYAQCLDRPAFREHFTDENNFADFDRAMEDTLIALNTGYARLQDGTAIERAKGKVHLIRPEWRGKVDQITFHIESIRKRFQQILGLDKDIRLRFSQRSLTSLDWDMEALDQRFRNDQELSEFMDKERQAAISLLNAILVDMNRSPLRDIKPT